MIDWRTILTIPPHTQFAQNPQNYSSSRPFEDIEDFEYREVTSDEPVHASGVSVSNTGIAVQNHSLSDPPSSPLPLPCFVTFSDSHGRVRGGWDERATCAVRQCHGIGAGCQVELANGDRIPLRAVRAIGELNADGRLVSAWSV